MNAKIKTDGHVVMIPLPQQAHTTLMLQLAQLLIDNNVLVTFLSSESNYDRLRNPKSTPQIRFLTFPEPSEQPSPLQFVEYGKYIGAVEAAAAAGIDAIVNNDEDCCKWPRVSAVFLDGVYSGINQTVRKHGVAMIKVGVVTAAAVLLFRNTSLLFQCRLLPPPKDKDALDKFMEEPVGLIQSLPWLRGKDVLGFHHHWDASPSRFDPEADPPDAVLLNTWDDIETSALADLNGADTCAGKAMGIGPMAAWSAGKTKTPLCSFNLYTEDRRCLDWLAKHKPRTVVYVAFGSTGALSAQELSAIAKGLRHSGYPVLWVASKNCAGGVPADVREMLEENEARACLVEWAPQREVLGHPAVGAYVSHGGWISAQEAILAGVPLLCGCCTFVDQACNRRFLTHVVRVGLQLKQGCTSDDVVKAVKTLMEDPVASSDLLRNVELIRGSVVAAVAEGGSSHAALVRVLQIVRAHGICPDTLP